MQINVPENDLAAVAAKAIFDSLDDSKRDELVTHAIKKLITEKDNSYYGRKTSALQDAFISGVQTVVRVRVDRMLTEDEEIKAQIDAVIEEGVRAAFAGKGRERMVDRVTLAVSEALWT